MSAIESPEFPRGIAYGSSFGPAWSTSIARNQGGFEVNNQNWSMPLYEGDVIHGVKNQTQLDQLLAFFHGTAGMHNSFRFHNKADYQATAGTNGTVVFISGSTWQMYKTYTYGALTFSRKISKPKSGVVIAGGGTYSYDTMTGVITKTAGADPTGWTGDFDFPVRFNTDKMLPTWIIFRHMEIGTLPIIEIRI